MCEKYEISKFQTINKYGNMTYGIVHIITINIITTTIKI